MKTYRLTGLIVVSIVIAVLLATALTSFTRVSDSALAEVATPGAGAGAGFSRPSVASTNYLPIIFLNSATAGGAWLLAGNAGTNWATDFLGTTDNMTLTFRVSNTVAYRLVPAIYPPVGLAPHIIGGASANSVSPGLFGATIAGGGSTLFPNVITGTGYHATIAGGNGNTASGSVATVGGGAGNSASGFVATVGGGYNNTASGSEATVPGGYGNTASGDFATIPGGYGNQAGGLYSLAAGYQSQALHAGTFVWGDATLGTISSTASNQFLIRANGGVGINTNVPSRALEVNGKIGVYDGARTLYGGIATEVGAEIIDFGINDDSSNRFGGAYNSAAQGGLVRVDTRSGYDLFQFQGRAAGSSALMIQLAGLNSAGVFNAAGGFHGECLTTASNVFSANLTRSCNMDVAEGFAATQLTEPGDLVALVTTATGTPTVRKSGGAAGEVLVGVVSQNPGLVFDNGKTQIAGDNSNLITAGKTVVALVGRVNVKVSVENGAVHIGDALTSSSTPGVAIRATHAGKIIGYAMEEANAAGTVLTLVQPGYYAPVWEQAGESSSTAQIDALRREMWMMGIGLLTGGLVLGAVVAWLAVRRVQRQT